MLQQEEPQDYILATNECHSVGEFVEEAFSGQLDKSVGASEKDRDRPLSSLW